MVGEATEYNSASKYVAPFTRRKSTPRLPEKSGGRFAFNAGEYIMNKSQIIFGIAILVLALYGIVQYDRNSVCYEIISPQGKMDTIFLDKCRGQTLVLLREDIDENGDGKMDGYTYRWSTIKISSEEGAELIWKKEK
jgi:hypothetical protein